MLLNIFFPNKPSIYRIIFYEEEKIKTKNLWQYYNDTIKGYDDEKAFTYFRPQNIQHTTVCLQYISIEQYSKI